MRFLAEKSKSESFAFSALSLPTFCISLNTSQFSCNRTQCRGYARMFYWNMKNEAVTYSTEKMIPYVSKFTNNTTFFKIYI